LRRRLRLSSCITALAFWHVRYLGCVRHWREFTIGPCVPPELERNWNRIDVESPPPRRLVTRAMQLAVMDPADRHHELVADAPSERARLCKGEVMWIRRHSAAHQAGLPQHESSMVFIAQADRFAQRLD
jgi:hypothetical protein